MMGRRLMMPAAAALLCVAAGLSATADVGSADDDVVAFRVDTLNVGLSPLDERPNLETPQACVEHFMVACRAHEFDAAARALNFRLRGRIDEREAREAARRLFYVLNQNLWIDWERLPDRADGMVEGRAIGNAGPLAGQPRKSIRIGSVALDGREVPVRVQRVKAADRKAVWLFSAQTVDNIDLLYAAHGPPWIERWMPEWARERLWGRIPAWQWMVIVLLLPAAGLLGWLVGVMVSRYIARFAPGRTAEMIDTVRWPIALLVTSVVLYSGIKGLLELPGSIANISGPAALGLVVFSGVWVGMRVIAFVVDRIARDVIVGKYEEGDNRRQQLLTQITVLRHALMLVAAAVGVGILLVQLDLFRTLGIAMLTSAGVAAVIFGIAGHAVLGNLIAGLQIAFTASFRVGDTVFVEGNWGRIEELTYTYIVVRTWDERRLVMPIKHFINHTFENWSKTDAFLIKPIYLRVDYRADVEAIREKFLDLVKSDDAWAGDRDEPELLVTDCDDETVTLRLTCGGATPKDAWYLSCRLREQLIGWLQHEADGAYLPRQRIMMTGQSDGKGREREREDEETLSAR